MSDRITAPFVSACALALAILCGQYLRDWSGQSALVVLPLVSAWLLCLMYFAICRLKKTIAKTWVKIFLTFSTPLLLIFLITL